MKDFLDWLNDDAPASVTITVVIVVIVAFCVLLFGGLWLIHSGFTWLLLISVFAGMACGFAYIYHQYKGYHDES